MIPVNELITRVKVNNIKTILSNVFQAAASSSGGGHTIKDDGTSLTQRTNLNFQGLVVTDDSANDATIVDNVSGDLFLYYNFY